jgi:hypothetical protein
MSAACEHYAAMIGAFGSMSMNNDEDEAFESIDKYIRTRKQFDSSQPKVYLCDLEQIRRDQTNASPDLSIDELLETITASKHEWFKVYSRSGNLVVGLTRLTPFPSHLEDDRRVFGEFKCTSCGNRWKSAGSWKDKWQECKKCKAKCFPFTQRQLNDGGGVVDGERRPHRVELCQKCIEKGSMCMPAKYYAV